MIKLLTFYKKIQIINQRFYHIVIKDENNFSAGSFNNIYFYIKKNNTFEIYTTIENAHNTLKKIIYNSQGDLYSCGNDSLIKIWEENNGKYENIKTLNHSAKVNSIILLETQNLLISSGDGIKFWDINDNYKIIHSFDNTWSGYPNELEIIDNNLIIVRSSQLNYVDIISISEKKIINTIEIGFEVDAFKSIDKKGIILIGGKSKNIKIYRSDNFECIQTIENAHDDEIAGFIELYDGSIFFLFFR